MLIATVMRIRSGYGSIGVATQVSSGSLGTSALGYGGDLDQNATVSTDLPLVARRAELALLTDAIETARRGRGEAVLLTGEAGVGKTRLLIETQREAERRGVLVLKGRAVESGGAYRPLVEAFARASAPFALEAELAAVRPILLRRPIRPPRAVAAALRAARTATAIPATTAPA